MSTRSAGSSHRFGVTSDAVRRLRGELGFEGLLVSDFAAITEMLKHGTARDDYRTLGLRWPRPATATLSSPSSANVNR